jgi:hypothetical protein
MQDHIESYLRQGFEEIKTDSGTGSRVLIHRGERKVVKFNQDPAYDKFAELALANPLPSLPKIFSHEKPLGEFKALSNDEYTVTKIELLEPLSVEEQQSILSWINAVYSWLKTGAKPSDMPSDTHGLQSAFDCLRSEAIRTGVCLDLSKGSNYMKRVDGSKSRFVITDPFN